MLKKRELICSLAVHGVVAFFLFGLKCVDAQPQNTNPDHLACDTADRFPEKGIPACSRLLEARPPSGNRAAIYNNRGAGWATKKRLDLAIADFSRAIDLDLHLTVAYSNRASAYFARREFDGAISDYNEILKIKPADFDALYNRGCALTAKGETDSAISDFSAVLALDPKNVHALVARAFALQSIPEFERALSDLKLAEQIDPKNWAIYDTRSIIFESEEKLDDAIREEDKAISLAANQFTPWLRRSSYFRERGKLEEGLRDINRAIQIAPNSAAAFNSRALLMREKGDVVNALSDFGQAIAFDGRFSNAYVNRAELYRVKGDLDRALGDLDRALDLAPSSAYYLMVRGVTWRYKGELEKSLNDLTLALKSEPQFVTALVERGITLEKLGRRAEAQADYLNASKAPMDKRPLEDIKARNTAKARLQSLLPSKEIENKSQVDEKRIALVIGNSAYKNAQFLENPRRDAYSVAEALKNAGFANVKFVSDLDKNALMRALEDFAHQAEQADWAVVYFAGHGMEVNGVNYLVPTNVEIGGAQEMLSQLVSLENVIAAASGAKKLKLVLLDACRENPFAEKIAIAKEAGRNIAARGLERLESAGLAQINPTGSTMVVFAAKHGEFALDGETDGHSPFASALLKRLLTRGVEISKMFRLVHDDVMELTAGRQEPYTYGALPGNEEFYFENK